MRSLFVLAVLVLLGVSGRAQASAFNIDFGSGHGIPSVGYGAAAGTGGLWNMVNANGVATTGVLDTLGLTSITVTFFADTTGGSSDADTTDGDKLVNDNFFSFGGPWTVNATGLANGAYSVYLYEPDNENVGTGSGNANGVAFSNIAGNYSGAFILNSNYLLLQNVLVSGNTLTVTGSGGLSGLSGMQIVEGALQSPVPEPGTMLLLGMGLMGTAYTVRRRRRDSRS